jgi:hypothetical protein
MWWLALVAAIIVGRAINLRSALRALGLLAIIVVALITDPVENLG